MSTFNPRTFTSLGLLRSLPEELLRRFFEPHNAFLEQRGFTWPEPGAPLDYQKMHRALLRADGPEPTKELANAMFIVDEMANPEGLAAIVDALHEINPKYEVPLDVEPAVFALQQWLASPQLVEETNLRRFVHENRSFHSFRSNKPLPHVARLSQQDLGRLQESVRTRLAHRYPAASIGLHQFPEEGVLRFLVRHGGALLRESIVAKENAWVSDSYLFRREIFDVVIYDPAANEVRIHGSKRDCDLYTRAFGSHFLNDEDAFPDIDKYSLEPLRTSGAESLACGEIEGLESITLVEIEIFFGGKLHEATIRKATDIFASAYVQEKGITMGGTLQRARFSVKFADMKRPRFVTVETPNKAKFKRDDDGKLIELWLRFAGFVIPDTAEATERLNAATDAQALA